MALATYNDLTTAIADWLDRTDLSAGTINTFVTLAEVDIFQRLRIREMETVGSAVISSSVIPLPTGYLELKSAYIDTNPLQALQKSTPDFIRSKYSVTGDTGVPRYIAREGTNFIFGPGPNSNYTVDYIYYQEPTSLATSLTTNSISSRCMSLYLYGSLIQAATYLGQEDKIGLWSTVYERLLNNFNQTQETEGFSGNFVSVNPSGY